MGLVFRAYHPDLERTGAVKVMQAITPDADTVARFRHEAQAIARMRHPNIVDVYDFGEYQGTPYMIVEYVPGGSLAARMAHGALDRYTALRYLRGIAAGLDYAHAHGVVHRDVKPANVLLGADDAPVLADFGLAKLLQGSSLKSMTGVTTGTPAYMAPEQVTGRQVGPAADRYSLATIAYEMLTGVIPFDGEALMELLYAQVHREPAPPSSRYPDLGPEVDTVIMRGLAKDPAARWETCTAFVDALGAALAAPVAAAPPARSASKTMVMDAPLASTVPVAKVAGADRAMENAGRPATIAVAYPSPPDVLPETVPAPPPAKPRVRVTRRRVAMGAAAVLILLLVLGVCAVGAQGTTLTLSPATATPGGTVQLTATHVPANQAGLIELHSVVWTYPFRANAKGVVNRSVTVPRDVGSGAHTVSICWNGSCHASTTLRIVSETAQASPTSGPTPGIAPSPTPHPASTPTPRPTAPPGSGPGPTAQPTAEPTAPPTSTPTPNPCPTPTQSAYLTASPASVVGGGTVTITGQNFTPKQPVTVNYYYPSSSTTPKQTRSSTVACSSGFTVTFTTGVLDVGTVRVVAVDAYGRHASTTFSVA